ncbi:gp512 [Bacillus phage G]|uniref:Gp512 n=1 Tax=Bacillus phage G TaxID=2884420 RepID=G3MAQ3_9CAUD|nr:gp512 [Bacillus phage G]AEO93770.1 gp512 [Bacillus phage G]
MGTLILYAITLHMLHGYTKSLFIKKKHVELLQQSVFELMKESENSGMSKEAFKMGTRVIGLLMVIYYLCYFIASGLVINSFWAMILCALMGVVTVHNYMKATVLIDTGKAQKLRVIEVVFSRIGLIYTIYFLVFFTNLKFEDNIFMNVVIAALAGYCVVKGYFAAQKQIRKAGGK